MNSTETFRNYRHDITGKFKDITMAINSINESTINDPESLEIFEAIHEVLVKMVKTSGATIEAIKSKEKNGTQRSNN
jgi:hypothetical protein